ncbi:MAG: DUF2784 domain-containing protein [Xanthomonadales bacterium]|nr:DUF2784 domain-containing protein [Xanthomonadales bacterium]
MAYRIAADLLVVIHGLFIVFVVTGGFLVLWRRWVAWIHLPTAVWGAVIEFAGWICPLTPLENHFRMLAGQKGYAGGFIEHYLIPVIYPDELTRGVQLALGLFVIVINGVAYGLVAARWKKRSP